jgi:hypothetical protein
MFTIDSLDSSRNLEANYAISFLFRLHLILHAYKIPTRCDSFEILNFATWIDLDTAGLTHQATTAWAAAQLLIQRMGPCQLIE